MKSSSLRPTELGAIAALATIAIAVVIGFSYGLELSVLLLAASALGLVIALLWASVRNLTGDTPLTLDEALMLGAPSTEEEQKRAVLRALKDLEFERSVGKISEADYQAYSARYREEARRLIERVDASLGQARELAEKLLTERVQQSNLDAEEGRDRNDSEPERAKPKASASEQSKQSVAAHDGEDEDDDDDDDDADHDDDDDADRDDDDDDGDDDDADHDDDDDDSDRKLTNAKPPTSASDTKAARSASAPCRACDGSNDADAKFCKHCGAALDTPARSARKSREREEKTR
jgi:hypothetical protein